MGGNLTTSKAPPPRLIILDPAISKTTPDYHPLGEGTLSHPPQYGFEENGKRRKEREMIATQVEMESAKVPMEFRDFCAHKWIAFETCKRDKFPFVYRCHHERHEYEFCQVKDYVVRMKEFERERRLLHRKVRKEEKAAMRAHREAAAGRAAEA